MCRCGASGGCLASHSRRAASATLQLDALRPAPVLSTDWFHTLLQESRGVMSIGSGLPDSLYVPPIGAQPFHQSVPYWAAGEPGRHVHRLHAAQPRRCGHLARPPQERPHQAVSAAHRCSRQTGAVQTPREEGPILKSQRSDCFGVCTAVSGVPSASFGQLHVMPLLPPLHGATPAALHSMWLLHVPAPQVPERRALGRLRLPGH